jgi:ABC-type glycerol-3-phosphate transport system substrate-binding protein
MRRDDVVSRSDSLTLQETPMRRHALIALRLRRRAGLPRRAQKVTEVNFYYPVAVGGPVTKTIDQMAADFGKENPDIKVNPIYSGTYQESIVKVLTAIKSGKPPQLAVLLSTDMFSLIDEDAIVPIDDIARAPTTGSGSTASTRAS